MQLYVYIQPNSSLQCKQGQFAYRSEKFDFNKYLFGIIDF